MRVTLVGGPADGLEVDAQHSTVMVEYPLDRAGLGDPLGQRLTLSLRVGSELYRRHRLFSTYPIPGWEFELHEDYSRGGRDHVDGVQPLWCTAVWTTDARKAKIERQLVRLNAALDTLGRTRRFYRRSDALPHRYAQQRVDEAIAELVEVTTPARRRAA